MSADHTRFVSETDPAVDDARITRIDIMSTQLFPRKIGSSEADRQIELYKEQHIPQPKIIAGRNAIIKNAYLEIRDDCVQAGDGVMGIEIWQ